MPVILSLSTAPISQTKQLHVSSNDDSHYTADHKSLKTNCLQLHWWVQISNLTNVLLYHIHGM